MATWTLVMFIWCKWDSGATTMVIPGFRSEAACLAAGPKINVTPPAYQALFACVEVK